MAKRDGERGIEVTEVTTSAWQDYLLLLITSVVGGVVLGEALAASSFRVFVCKKKSCSCATMHSNQQQTVAGAPE